MYINGGLKCKTLLVSTIMRWKAKLVFINDGKVNLILTNCKLKRIHKNLWKEKKV